MALIASCSQPPPRSRKKKPPRVVREPDDTNAGAVVIPMTDGRVVYHGTLDGPTSNTIDWLRLDRPPQRGGYVVVRRSEADVWLQFFGASDGREVGARNSSLKVKEMTTFEVEDVSEHLLVEVSTLGRDVGSYDLEITFVPWVEPPVIDTPDAAPAVLPYCAIGVIADTCRHAPSCDWVKVDYTNPHCAPELKPPWNPPPPR